jgi:7-cyano-7-deazaguanine reductase
VYLDAPEFTAVCPKTGQPDFATIKILYCPDKKLVESKSLKFYLFAFRGMGMFHEFVVNKIARDLFEVMQPHWIEVQGDFMPRGGISINPVCRLEKWDGQMQAEEPKHFTFRDCERR